MKVKPEQTHYIAGVWYEGQGESIQSVSPVNSEILWMGHSATSHQVNEAVCAARAAQFDWYALGFDKRKDYILAFTQKLQEQEKNITHLIAEETGKTLWETATEVKAMQGKAQLSIQAYHERTGQHQESLPLGDMVIRHKPHGVMAVFAPFNFPGHLPNGHIIPALLAGNTVVLKPSELTPRVGQVMMQFWHDIGLPEGVLNLVQGDVETGKALAQHPQVDGILFTGSSRVGHMLHQQYAAQPHKILALEMGGNNPLVVKGVQDHQAAVHDIIQSAYMTSGQRCTCARRLYIEQGQQGDALIRDLIRAVEKVKVGAFDAEPQPFMGSLISEKAALAIVAAQEKLVGLGGKPLVSVTSIKAGTGLVRPGVIDMSEATSYLDEEYFGPLLQIYRYTDFDEAIALANQTAYGLSAGLLADDRADYDYFRMRIRAGIVNWNKQITGALGQAPFGGVGASGNHRASAYYAADYCAYPVASIEQEKIQLPEQIVSGLDLT